MLHGCTTAEIVAAIGLELHDLFPPVDWQNNGVHRARAKRPRPDWPAMVVACERDLLLTKIVLTWIARGDPMGEADAAACQAASTRVLALIQEARDG